MESAAEAPGTVGSPIRGRVVVNLAVRTLLTILVPLAIILGAAGYLTVSFVLDAQETRSLVLQTHDRIESA